MMMFKKPQGERFLSSPPLGSSRRLGSLGFIGPAIGMTSFSQPDQSSGLIFSLFQGMLFGSITHLGNKNKK